MDRIRPPGRNRERDLGAAGPHSPSPKPAPSRGTAPLPAATEPEFHAVADLIGAAEPPLAAAMRNEVFCVLKVDKIVTVAYGDFAPRPALSCAAKGKRRPKIW